MKGLVIAEPWIGRILSGRKTWEMRSRTTHHRGEMALIRKGSGHVVGVAEIVDALAPLATRDAYAAAEPYHAIMPREQPAAFSGGWRTPWVLANVQQLRKPVPYEHPSGAVIWVDLAKAVVAAIRVQLSDVNKPLVASTPSAGVDQAPTVATLTATAAIAPVSAPPRRAQSLEQKDVPHGAFNTRTVNLTGGNVRNHHIYLPLDFFPDDAVGGSNRHAAARRTVTVVFVPGQTVETDIDGTKRILRNRGAMRDFFERAAVEDGDSVLIARTSTYSYTFSKVGK